LKVLYSRRIRAQLFSVMVTPHVLALSLFEFSYLKKNVQCVLVATVFVNFFYGCFLGSVTQLLPTNITYGISTSIRDPYRKWTVWCFVILVSICSSACIYLWIFYLILFCGYLSFYYSVSDIMSKHYRENMPDIFRKKRIIINLDMQAKEGMRKATS
jgi:hypothetical protein